MINIYVGNLPYDTTEAQLVEHFSAHGEVRRASIVMDRETGRSRGFGFVEMADRAEGQAAIEAMSGQNFNGRPITINEARPRGSGTTGGTAGFASSAGLGSAQLAQAQEEASRPASAGYSNPQVPAPSKPKVKPKPQPATDAESAHDSGPPRDEPKRADPVPDEPDDDTPPSSGYSNAFIRD